MCLLAVMPLVALAVGQRDQPSTPPPAPVLDAELGVPIGTPLFSAPATSPPVMDGIVDAVWEGALPLKVSLHLGLHGDESAGELELRSLHDDRNVYFLASWPAETPGGEPGAWRNLLTIHWRLVDPGLVSGESTASEGLACTVACHTATADGQGRLVGVRSETIPPGLDDDLPSGGGWAQGRWTLEWSRPRASTSPYDQHMLDPVQSYRLFVKLFQGKEGRADPVSDVHELRLAR
jgi:hypothetical protein